MNVLMAGWASSTTLKTLFEPRRNSLNALRLLFALLVVVSHAWPLNGSAWEPRLGGMTLGTWSVVGFFAISGFLITRSRMSGRPARDFWRARALRIFPGLLVALVIVAFVFAPLSLLLQPEAEWDPIGSVTYVLRNALLYPPGLYELGIPNTLVGMPFRDWDGPIWTLFWEGCCYVVIGVGVSLLGRGRALSRAAVVVLVACTGLGFLSAAGVALPELLHNVLPLFSAFAAGTLMTLFADRIPVSRGLVAAAVVLLLLGIGLRLAPVVAPAPFALLVLLLSTVLRLERVGSVYDISYGVYIYAWPVQQMLVLAHRPGGIPVPLTIVLTIVLTLPLAYLSCRFVEKPALALNRSRTVVPVP